MQGEEYTTRGKKWYILLPACGLTVRCHVIEPARKVKQKKIRHVTANLCCSCTDNELILGRLASHKSICEIKLGGKEKNMNVRAHGW